MRNDWKVGDLCRNGLGRYALVVVIEQLLAERSSTEAFMIGTNGEWERAFPYSITNRWSRLHTTGLQYDFVSYEQTQLDFKNNLFDPFFP